MSPAVFKMIMMGYVVITAVAVVFLWRNPAGPDNIKTISTMVGSVVLAAISILPFFGTDKRTKKYSLVLFYDREANRIPFEKTHPVYRNNYGDICPIFPPMDSFTCEGSYESFADSLGFDAIEHGLMASYLQHFQASWDQDITAYVGPGRAALTAPRTQSKGKVFSPEEAASIFSDNPLISSSAMFSGSRLSKLPMGCVITSSRGEDRRNKVLKFDTDVMTITIDITRYSGGLSNGTAWNWFRVTKNAKPHQIWEVGYLVTVTGETKPGLRYPRDIENYWKWYEEIARLVSAYDWAVIDAAIRNQHTVDLLRTMQR